MGPPVSPCGPDCTRCTRTDNAVPPPGTLLLPVMSIHLRVEGRQRLWGLSIRYITRTTYYYYDNILVVKHSTDTRFLHMTTNHTHTRRVDPLFWYASDSFAIACIAVVLTLFMSAACYQARSRRRLLLQDARMGVSL